MEYAVPLEEIAAHIDALMAGNAAERFENLITGQLLRRDRVGFALKPAVEAAARRNQRSFECDDRIQDSCGVRLAPVSVAKLRRRFGVGTQLAP